MTPVREVDNRDLQTIIKAQEDRIASMSRRIVELMGDVQRLERDLDAAHAAIHQAMEHLIVVNRIALAIIAVGIGILGMIIVYTIEAGRRR